MLGIRYLYLVFILLLLSNRNYAQTIIYGAITDTTGKVLPYANITVGELNKGTVSDESGRYRLDIPQGTHEISFSLIGFRTFKIRITSAVSEKQELNVVLKEAIKNLDEISVIGQSPDIHKIPVREFENLPDPSSSVESLIKTMPGVSSSDELSSQYSVRGGNFDENLVYVNDIEIIRPFLIRSGQQEGLSFINPDMVSNVRFSPGGFEARYGDKMSSVLDVNYRIPQKNGIRLYAGLLGGSFTAEGVTENEKLSIISGIRYKTTELLLGSLDNKGEYEPDFTDWQMMLNYKLSGKLTIGLLTNYARNSYKFIPETRNTSFGTYANVYNLKIYYNGREDDRYNSMLGALSLQYRISSALQMKFTLNTYKINEQERFDISGEYFINELDAYPGSKTYGDSILNIGVGAMLNHARNYLDADIREATHGGSLGLNNHFISWEARYQYTKFDDRLNEWEYLDSAGYSYPYSDNSILLNNYAYSENHLIVHKITAFVQDRYTWKNSGSAFTLVGGIRFHGWSLTSEKLISPRLRFSVQPLWKQKVVFYAASGIYYQPPVYKELRNFRGEMNLKIKAQQSVHFLVGTDIMLNLWERPFKYTVEAYYKDLNRLIPYRMDNVRIRYTARNNAKGYATGLDMRLYGEFVDDVESWASVSLLRTREDLSDDYYVTREGFRKEPGYYHRPTDQLFHINLFFQDYLPNYPSLIASLNLVYGSGFFVAPPRSSRFDITFPLGSYRRVDLGLSKTFETRNLPQFKSFRIGAEIFNLFDIRNKASFMWVQTVSNQENVSNNFAVPNYLTSRRLNVHMTLKF